MVAATSQLHTKVLQRAKSEDDFAVYRAALEWALTDPIVIESRDDFKSEYRWKDRLEPFHHQVQNLITFCRRLPVTLLADDVGLGKTISAGLIASELMARNRVSRILVVAPKLLGPQWKEELESKFDIPAEFVTGNKLLTAEPDPVGAVITTYHSARLYLERLPENRFDMLVLDEAHKLRNLYGVDPTPQVAKVFHRALQQRRFRYVLMLTATPIQNRLWDLFSLIDLLTAARGHENPFGSEGLFARRFIADKRDQARSLKPEAREEFRKVVYGYMSRVRRGDAKLDFPERRLQLHRVKPTAPELALIDAIAEPIQALNRLVQISILQALTSSPHALMAQLNNMAQKGTVPPSLAATVRDIVIPMKTSAKLEGLGQLMAHLQRENPESWRMVVFTGRLETQTTIQLYLEQLGLTVGIINGSSGQRNQDTIARFKANPPEIRAIVSTEAGSEGVNLQVANVLINFDLPWNPMIVEQRIGRVQRLGSIHKNVVIYNVMLAGTFEEYIVGRLMTKLQMATDAIGDIESLLEASGVGAEGDEGTGMDEKIRELVVAALAGRDVAAATKRMEQSIEAANTTLRDEKANIDATLGGMDGYEYVGPRAPTLSPPKRSMDFEPFLRAAFTGLGYQITDYAKGVWRVTSRTGQEYVRLQQHADERYAHAPLYAPGSPAFLRLVDKVTASGLHQVADQDTATRQAAQSIAEKWAKSFGGTGTSLKIRSVRRKFEGEATVRVRATTAHDSYERLVEVPCAADAHVVEGTEDGLSPLPDPLHNPKAAGFNDRIAAEEAHKDPDIAEFTRFYLERRAQEAAAAGSDDRKRKKLEDEFTPRLDTRLEAMCGSMRRAVDAQISYQLDGRPYESQLTIVPSSGQLSAPALEACEVSHRLVPIETLAPCAISRRRALKHLLICSEASGRHALPEHLARCSVTGAQLVTDEVGVSDITRAPVDLRILKTCAVTRRRGEQAYFDVCAFTGGDILKDELARSDVSGCAYRRDQSESSVVSGRSGHRSEFTSCYETRAALLPSEGRRCAVTNHFVRPELLATCEATGKSVLPSELETSAISGRRVLRSLLIQSSVSSARFLESEAVRSAYGIFCAPIEAKTCQWSGMIAHPEDIRTCALLGLPVHFQFVTEGTGRLAVVEGLMNGTQRSAQQEGLWTIIREKAAKAINNSKCQIEAAELSADSKTLAICAELKSMFGMRTQHAGFLYSLEKIAIVGHIAIAKRDTKAAGGIRV